MSNGMFLLLVLWTVGNLAWTLAFAFLIRDLGKLLKAYAARYGDI